MLSSYEYPIHKGLTMGRRSQVQGSEVQGCFSFVNLH